jgi:two-component system CheB/CheR fusion protein
METRIHPPVHSATYAPEKATALALRLAHAENALRVLTSGQVDAIIDPDGRAYLLRPAQEQLRQTEQRLRATIESSTDVITVVNRGGEIVSQSNAAKRTLSYEPDEMVGKRFFEFVHTEDLPKVHAAYVNVIEGLIDCATVQFSHRDGFGVHRLIDASLGKLRGISPSCVVISMRAAAPQERPRAKPTSREPAPASGGTDRFLAMLSHELRTPLTPVIMAVGELIDDERFADAHPTLNMIRRNIQLQSRVLEELTDFVAVGQHKVRLKIEAVDVHEHVQFVVEICRQEIVNAQIEMLCYLRASEHTVLADSARLQQVMWNLVKNAVKFSALGSIISITTINDPPGYLTIEVADHGIGIEPDLLPRVFDAFQQDDHSPRERDGLGLGLFIAQGLAEAQGGTLSAHSGGRGMGVTLRLCLPLIKPGEVAASAKRESVFFPPVSASAVNHP